MGIASSCPHPNKTKVVKKYQETKNEEDLICPITHFLPWDPVIAEDGICYERSAIEEYFSGKKKKQGKIRSPMTGVPIGTHLTAAPQIKITIEALIENGDIITEDLVEDWKTKVKEQKDTKALLKLAAQGDVEAMECVAIRYDWGMKGFKPDRKMAYYWYKRASVAGSLHGKAKVGNFLVAGAGVKKDVTKGMTYLGMAAGQGSDVACYILGMILADGNFGVLSDKEMAQELLEKALDGTCSENVMAQNGVARERAQKKLDEIIKQQKAKRGHPLAHLIDQQGSTPKDATTQEQE